MNIDVHAHMVPASLLAKLGAEAAKFPSMKMEPANGSLAFALPNGSRTRAISPALSDVAARLAWMDEQGIDRQLVGGWLDMFGYELPPGEGEAWARLINEDLLAFCADEPRFVALPTVPLQDGAAAARVLSEVMDAGAPGVMIGTQPRGRGGVLDAADLDPFWQLASDRRALVFIHPVFDSGDERVADYGLANAIGRVTDATIAVARLLCSGHPTRYAGARILACVGGGALPFALGRLKRNHALNPDEVADPLEQLRALYFDTILHDVKALRFLTDLVGTERVMMGSDKPFPIGDPEPAKIIEQGGFTPAECQRMLGRTAAKLFDL